MQRYFDNLFLALKGTSLGVLKNNFNYYKSLEPALSDYEKQLARKIKSDTDLDKASMNERDSLSSEATDLRQILDYQSNTGNNLARFLPQNFEMREPLEIFWREVNSAMKELNISDSKNEGDIQFVAPTGIGKSVFASHLFSSIGKDKKILFLCHRLDLAIQIAEKLSEFLPERDIKNLSSAKLKEFGIGKFDHNGSDVVIAVTNSFQKKHESLEPFDLIVIDEAHRFYDQEIMQKLSNLKKDSKSLLVGFTATPDHYYLSPAPDRELVRVDNSFVYINPEKTAKSHYKVIKSISNFKDAIKKKFIAPFKYLSLDFKDHKLDIDSLGYENSSIGEDINSNSLNQENLYTESFEERLKSFYKDNQDLFKDKKHILISPSIDIAERMTEIFNDDLGLKTKTYTSAQTDNERKKARNQLKGSEVQALSSVRMLEEGFDNKDVEIVWILSPVNNILKLKQIVGRALRQSDNLEKDVHIIQLNLNNSNFSHVTINNLLDYSIDNNNSDKKVVPPQGINLKTIDKDEKLKEKFRGFQTLEQVFRKAQESMYFNLTNMSDAEIKAILEKNLQEEAINKELEFKEEKNHFTAIHLNEDSDHLTYNPEVVEIAIKNYLELEKSKLIKLHEFETLESFAKRNFTGFTTETIDKALISIKTKIKDEIKSELKAGGAYLKEGDLYFSQVFLDSKLRPLLEKILEDSKKEKYYAKPIQQHIITSDTTEQNVKKANARTKKTAEIKKSTNREVILDNTTKSKIFSEIRDNFNIKHKDEIKESLLQSPQWKHDILSTYLEIISSDDNLDYKLSQLIDEGKNLKAADIKKKFLNSITIQYRNFIKSLNKHRLKDSIYFYRDFLEKIIYRTHLNEVYKNHIKESEVFKDLKLTEKNLETIILKTLSYFQDYEKCIEHIIKNKSLAKNILFEENPFIKSLPVLFKNNESALKRIKNLNLIKELTDKSTDDLIKEIKDKAFTHFLNKETKYRSEKTIEEQIELAIEKEFKEYYSYQSMQTLFLEQIFKSPELSESIKHIPNIEIQSGILNKAFLNSQSINEATNQIIKEINEIRELKSKTIKPTHRDLNAAKLLLSSKIDSSKMPSDTELNRLLISLSDKDYISFNPTREIFYPLKSIIKLIKHLKIQQTLTKQESKKKTEANFLSLADYYRALPQVQKEKVKINIAGLKQFFNVYIQSQYPGVNLLEAGYKNNNDLFQRDFLKKFFDNCLLFFSGEN
ncbi:MAG: DEAD/DEAH box helicase family protein [Candidatus Caenarcaniphilales bacterium]|nr:DEAD/DEAH box helicase family protein [Candidatus Caenarcaniphilales bacterium]